MIECKESIETFVFNRSFMLILLYIRFNLVQRPLFLCPEQNFQTIQ